MNTPDDNDRWWVIPDDNVDVDLSSDTLDENNSATDSTTCNGGTSSMFS